MPDTTVLGWFWRGWTLSDPGAWIASQFGVIPYGLQSIFTAAAERRLPRPPNTRGLRAVLQEHLVVEGGPDRVRVDDHSLRVLSHDGDGEISYCLIDDPAVAAAPDRLAFWLHDDWRLPERTLDDAPAVVPGGARTRFVPDVPVVPASLPRHGDVSSYAVLLTYADGDRLGARTPVVFPGVPLRGLAAHLRGVRPAPAEAWPEELLVLRALVAPDEDSVSPALQRASLWPGFTRDESWDVDLRGPHDAVHVPAAERVDEQDLPRRGEEPSLLRVRDHLVQFAQRPANALGGYQQWYLFDDVWALAHPDLAQSLLRFAAHWDPLAD